MSTISAPKMRDWRDGFSLLEMLVVIAIIALLAGLVLGSYRTLMEQSRRQRTHGIVTALATALAQSSQVRGGSYAPIEHPLAASRAPRSAFLRGDTGSPMAVTGQAYRGASHDQVNSDRLLTDDDRFADISAPMLYGAARRQLGLLGVPQADTTDYRLLPSTGVITNPDSSGRLVQPNGTPAESRDFIRRIFTASGAWDELMKSKAVWNCPDPDSNTSNLIVENRLWSMTQAGLRLPGTTTVTVAGVPHRYRLRGTGFYDAWGNEILYAILAGERVQFLSAGRDGGLQWNPGNDGLFATAADAAQPAGDDRDARLDNVASSSDQE